MRSLISLDRHIIHRETFQGGDQGVRLNPYHRSVPTAMAYGNAGGRIGSYGIFNGATSKVDCGSDFIGTQAITVCAWIYMDGASENNQQSIIDNGRFRFQVWYSTNVLMLSSNDSSWAYSNTPNIFPNVWYHVVGTRTSSGLGALYINGVPISLNYTSSGTPVAGGNVTIGNKNIQDRTFNGFINLEVYDLVLTADEVWALYNGRLYR